LGNFEPLLLTGLLIGFGLIAYLCRNRIKALLKRRKKEDAAEFRRLLELRTRKLGDRWLPTWPKVLAVYDLRERLPIGQQESSAALGNALKKAFVSLSRKEADTIARMFSRAVYVGVRRDMEKAAEKNGGGKM